MRWDPDFDVYLSRVDGKLASFVVDLAAPSHAPLASHTLLLEIHVELANPRPDGLRDGEEMEPLAALEDAFVRALEEKVDAIYVGRMIHAGRLVLYLYVPAAHRDALEELPELTGDPPEPYLPEWGVSDDPDWRLCREFLAPDPHVRQEIQNRRVIRAFTEQGDALDRPRPVDHLVFFPERGRAEQAATALRGAGFVTEEIPAAATDPRGWPLQFQREEVLAGGRPDAFVAEVIGVVEPLGGDYDGWGAEMVPAGPPGAR